MSRKHRFGLCLALVLALVTFGALFYVASQSAIFSPKGIVGLKERNLMLVALGLSLIVVVPVYAMVFTFAWKYREGNKAAKYTPDWDHSRLFETIWWGVPTILILILSVITWQSSHDLDPFKPLSSSTKSMTIQVVALDWKWLFIYPEQNIATVNYVQFPEKTPVDFEITADAPMNSFWIPRLGGQIYAMAGMSTHLHLMADGVGSYRGSSANISGRGFAGMKFEAKSTSSLDFKRWVNTVKQSQQSLTQAEYNRLAKPSENNKTTYYSSGDADLYNLIVMKYMVPGIQLAGQP